MQNHHQLTRPSTVELAAACSLLLLIIGTGLLYWPGSFGPFLLDDFHNLAKSQINNFNLEELMAATFANTSGPLKRPVAAFSFAVTNGLYGAEPWGYKWHNILLHLLCGSVVFLLSRAVFKALNVSGQQQLLGAIICTAFWLLHPLQVSTVLYAVQRMTQLSALFILLSGYCYLIIRQQTKTSQSLSITGLFVVLPALAALGLLSKENAALIPVFILLIESVLFRFQTRQTENTSALKVFWLIFIVVPLTLGAGYFFTHLGILNFSHRDFTLSQRLMSEALILIDYWQMIVLANIQSMGLFHDGVEIIRRWDWRVSAALVFHASLIIGALLLHKKPLLTLAIGWFYVSHLLESTALPLELMFEHRNYLSVLSGGFLLAGLVVYLQHKKIVLALALALIAVFASSSHERIQYWSSSETIYNQMLNNHPSSMRAHIAYANHLLQQKRYYQASQIIIKAGQLDHGDAGPMLHLLKLSCYGEIDFKAGFYPLLHQQLSARPLSIYSKKILHDISRLYIDQRCDSIGRDQLEAIIGAANQNPIVQHSNVYQGFLLTLKARIISTDDYRQADRYYRQAYRAAASPGLLDEHAAMLIKHQQTDLAKQVATQLINDFKPMTATQRRDHRSLLQWYHEQKVKGDKP